MMRHSAKDNHVHSVFAMSGKVEETGGKSSFIQTLGREFLLLHCRAYVAIA